MNTTAGHKTLCQTYDRRNQITHRFRSIVEVYVGRRHKKNQLIPVTGYKLVAILKLVVKLNPQAPSEHSPPGKSHPADQILAITRRAC